MLTNARYLCRRTITLWVMTFFITGLSILILPSCKKNSSAQTGTISGVVSPATAAFVVRATSTSGSVVSYFFDYGSGEFTLPGLAYDTWSIQAYPRGGYALPDPVLVRLNAPASSKHNINISEKADDGKMTYSIDGVVHTAFHYYSRSQYVAPEQLLFLYMSTVDAQSIYQLYIGVDDVTAPGTYAIRDVPDLNCQVTRMVNDTYVEYWGTFNGGSGVLTLNSFDTISRRASGTFTVTAIRTVPDANDTLVITDGTFENLFME
jgi:hypothetical protein